MGRRICRRNILVKNAKGIKNGKNVKIKRKGNISSFFTIF